MNKSGVSSSATCKQIEIFVFLMIAIDIPNEILRKEYNKNLIFKFVLHDLGLGFENPNIMLTFVVMKKLIITLFLTCLTLTGQSQTKWALVVGIGPYPQESGWNAIHGDNDIELVCSFLSEIGANHQHIKVLKNEIATNRISFPLSNGYQNMLHRMIGYTFIFPAMDSESRTLMETKTTAGMRRLFRMMRKKNTVRSIMVRII